MLPEKVRKSNIAAGVWFISMFALIYVVVSGDGGNIWDDGDLLGIAIFSVHAISLFTALWCYAEAKGYSGLLGVGLAFLYALGLIILLFLPDKTKAVDKSGEYAVDESPPIVPFEKQGNYFVRLFAGDVPLVVTYWVWGGILGAVLTVVAGAIEFNYASIITKPYGATLVRAFYWLVLAYAIFIWVAIWRSAGKYQGSGWGVVARVMVVMGVLSTLGAFIQGFDEEASTAEEVRMMNNSLPTMLDDSTRLDAVEYDSDMDTLMYLHTMVDGSVDEYDTAYFRDAVKKNIVTNLCESGDTRPFLRNGTTYAYSYVDMHGAQIADVIVTESDCN